MLHLQQSDDDTADHTTDLERRCAKCECPNHDGDVYVYSGKLGYAPIAAHADGQDWCRKCVEKTQMEIRLARQQLTDTSQSIESSPVPQQQWSPIRSERMTTPPRNKGEFVSPTQPRIDRMFRSVKNPRSFLDRLNTVSTVLSSTPTRSFPRAHNSCYINAVLTPLFALNIYEQGMLKVRVNISPKSLTLTLLRLKTDLAAGMKRPHLAIMDDIQNVRVIAARSGVATVMEMGATADAEEFYTCLLQASEVDTTYTDATTPRLISSTASSLQCDSCAYNSTEVPQVCRLLHVQCEHDRDEVAQNGSSRLSLQACFNRDYLNDERVTYRCPCDQSHSSARKQVRVAKTGSFLVLRIMYNTWNRSEQRSTGSRDMDFEDCQSILVDGTCYEIMAVTQHSGNHYTVNVKLSDAWWHFNDDYTARRISHKECMHNAYMVWLRRQSEPIEPRADIDDNEQTIEVQSGDSAHTAVIDLTMTCGTRDDETQSAVSTACTTGPWMSKSKKVPKLSLRLKKIIDRKRRKRAWCTPMHATRPLVLLHRTLRRARRICNRSSSNTKDGAKDVHRRVAAVQHAYNSMKQKRANPVSKLLKSHATESILACHIQNAITKYTPLSQSVAGPRAGIPLSSVLRHAFNMTDWHSCWQTIVPLACTEVPLPPPHQALRSDIFFKGMRIEFESRIPTPTAVKQRQAISGGPITWVINMINYDTHIRGCSLVRQALGCEDTTIRIVHNLTLSGLRCMNEHQYWDIGCHDAILWVRRTSLHNQRVFAKVVGLSTFVSSIGDAVTIAKTWGESAFFTRRSLSFKQWAQDKWILRPQSVRLDMPPQTQIELAVEEAHADRVSGAIPVSENTNRAARQTVYISAPSDEDGIENFNFALWCRCKAAPGDFYSALLDAANHFCGRTHRVIQGTVAAYVSKKDAKITSLREEIRSLTIVYRQIRQRRNGFHTMPAYIRLSEHAKNTLSKSRGPSMLPNWTRLKYDVCLLYHTTAWKLGSCEAANEKSKQLQHRRSINTVYITNVGKVIRLLFRDVAQEGIRPPHVSVQEDFLLKQFRALGVHSKSDDRSVLLPDFALFIPPLSTQWSTDTARRGSHCPTVPDSVRSVGGTNSETVERIQPQPLSKRNHGSGQRTEVCSDLTNVCKAVLRARKQGTIPYGSVQRIDIHDSSALIDDTVWSVIENNRPSQHNDWVVVTDGSKEDDKAGFAGLCVSDASTYIVLGAAPGHSSGVMELAAAIHAIQSIPLSTDDDPLSITVYSDYLTLTQCKWHINAMRDWPKHENIGLWEALFELYCSPRHRLTYHHVRAHVDEVTEWPQALNNEVDLLAKLARESVSTGLLTPLLLHPHRRRHTPTKPRAQSAVDLVLPLKLEEVQAALADLHEGSAGADNIPPALLRILDPQNEELLLHYLNSMFVHAKIHPALKVGRTALIHKGGTLPAEDPASWRRINVGIAVGTVFTKVLVQRLLRFVWERNVLPMTQKCNIRGVSGSRTCVRA